METPISQVNPEPEAPVETTPQTPDAKDARILEALQILMDHGGHIDNLLYILFNANDTTNPTTEGRLKYVKGATSYLKTYINGGVYHIDVTAG